MSYDVFFVARPGAAPPTIDDVRARFAGRRLWTLNDDATGGSYANDATGVEMDVSIRAPDDDEPAGRAPFVVYLSGLRAHVDAIEASDEIVAIARALDLLVDDPQESRTGEPDAAPLREGLAKYNRWLHTNHLRDQGNDPPPRLPRARREEVFEWNRRRDALAAGSDALFVPKILFASDGDTTTTVIAWADRVDARVPRVDSIQTTRAHVPWEVVGPTIAEAPFEDGHWVVTGRLRDRVFDAIDAADGLPPPRLVSPMQVMTQELVDELTLPPDARAKRREAVSLQTQGRLEWWTGKKKQGLAKQARAARLCPDDGEMALDVARGAYQLDDAPLALEMARRAFELLPAESDGALIAAASAVYTGKYIEGLRFADALLALAPDDRNGHVIRAAALTELDRLPEAVLACEAALRIAGDGMVENMLGFALAAAGRDAEAKAAYERALAALEAESARPQGDDDEEVDEEELAAIEARRAYALLGLGRSAAALTAAKKSDRRKRDDFLNLQSVGRALVALGQEAEAIAPLERALATRRAAPLAALALAKAHARLGNAEGRDLALRAAGKSPLCARLAAADPELSSAPAGASGDARAAKKGAAKKGAASPAAAAPKKKSARGRDR